MFRTNLVVPLLLELALVDPPLLLVGPELGVLPAQTLELVLVLLCSGW